VDRIVFDTSANPIYKEKFTHGYHFNGNNPHNNIDNKTWDM